MQIQGSNTLPAADGLMIYHNAYRARLLSVMREDFPALHRWLGDESFEQLALAYISAWPPRHFSLRWLGEKLPEFVRGYIAEPQRSPMLELATLEWAFTLAFDAPDAVPLSLDVMGSFSADDWVYLRVSLIPSASLVAAAAQHGGHVGGRQGRGRYSCCRCAVRPPGLPGLAA